MYTFLKRRKIIITWNAYWARYLSSSEVATALRPFYFAVHPDLFGQHPEQRMVNENSLKQISSFLNALQAQKPIQPVTVQFYLRGEKNERDLFKFIQIKLNEYDIRKTVLSILKACKLSTSFVDNIVSTESAGFQASKINSKTNEAHYYGTDEAAYDIFFTGLQSKIRSKKEELTLKTWLDKNVDIALIRKEAEKPIEDEIKRLKENLIETLKLKAIKWECGWNISHFRGCLEAFQALANHYPAVMQILKGRTINFAPFTGVSLEGDVLLNISEVRHNWLDLIKNVESYNPILLRIPSFEKAVSQVLLDIKIGRRKFMPKVMVAEYEKHLTSITTSLNDYKSSKKFPNSWPKSLQNYEIVIETEAGPLMLSPTGQFIVPSSIPGFLLVNFITENLAEATKLLQLYETNKHIEKNIHETVIKQLQLNGLQKDDCITPDLMIDCCEKLLKHKTSLKQLNNVSLYITTYYSVLTNGVVCIPWNWKL